MANHLVISCLLRKGHAASCADGRATSDTRGPSGATGANSNANGRAASYAGCRATTRVGGYAVSCVRLRSQRPLLGRRRVPLPTSAPLARVPLPEAWCLARLLRHFQCQRPRRVRADCRVTTSVGGRAASCGRLRCLRKAVEGDGHTAARVVADSI